MIFTVRVKANSKKMGLNHKTNDYIEVSITQPPTDGKANGLVIKLIADYFQVTQKQVRILQGEKRKEKIVEVRQ